MARKKSKVEVKVSCESTFTNYAKPASSSSTSEVKVREEPLIGMLHYEVRTPMLMYSAVGVSIVIIEVHYCQVCSIEGFKMPVSGCENSHFADVCSLSIRGQIQQSYWTDCFSPNDTYGILQWAPLCIFFTVLLKQLYSRF